jgi:hypothetical protein
LYPNNVVGHHPEAADDAAEELVAFDVAMRHLPAKAPGRFGFYPATSLPANLVTRGHQPMVAEFLLVRILECAA